MTEIVPTAPVSINTLIMIAYKRAGLLPVEATLAGANMTPKLEHGRAVLDTIIDSIATEGFLARTLVLHDLPIIAGETTHTLPSNVLDVYGDAMFVAGDALRSGSEMPVKQIGVQTWHVQTTKVIESTRPMLYAAFRNGVEVQLKLWPIPNEAGTLRVKVARLLEGVADGSKSIDLHRYWQDAIVWCLSYYLAVDSSLPTERCMFLAQVSEAKKAACVRYGMEHPAIQAQIDYTTQWSP